MDMILNDLLFYDEQDNKSNSITTVSSSIKKKKRKKRSKKQSTAVVVTKHKKRGRKKLEAASLVLSSSLIASSIGKKKSYVHRLPDIPDEARIIERKRNSIIIFDLDRKIWSVYIVAKDTDPVLIGEYDTLADCQLSIQTFKRSKKTTTSSSSSNHFVRTDPHSTLEPILKDTKYNYFSAVAGGENIPVAIPTKYRGVKWNTVLRTWQGQICKDSTRIDLGYFNTAEDCARAYNKQAVILRGENTRTLNMIPDGQATYEPEQYMQLYEESFSNEDLQLMKKLETDEFT